MEKLKDVQQDARCMGGDAKLSELVDFSKAKAAREEKEATLKKYKPDAIRQMENRLEGDINRLANKIKVIKHSNCASSILLDLSNIYKAKEMIDKAKKGLVQKGGATND